MVLSACNQGKKTLTSWSPFRGICNHLEGAPNCSAEAQCGIELGSVCACQNQHSATGTCSEPPCNNSPNGLYQALVWPCFPEPCGSCVALAEAGLGWSCDVGGHGFQSWEEVVWRSIGWGWVILTWGQKWENCLCVFVLVHFHALIFSFLVFQDGSVFNPTGSCYLWVHEDDEGILLGLYCLVRVFLFLFGYAVCSPN